MKFTLTNVAPAGAHVTDETYETAIGLEYPVTLDGTIIGGAVLEAATVIHDDDLGELVRLEFWTPGLTGLRVEGLPAGAP